MDNVFINERGWLLTDDPGVVDNDRSTPANQVGDISLNQPYNKILADDSH